MVIINADNRRYNLATWYMMEAGPMGAVKVCLPGVSFTIAFSDTTWENPVDPDVVSDVIRVWSGHHDTFTQGDLEAEYRAFYGNRGSVSRAFFEQA